MGGAFCWLKMGVVFGFLQIIVCWPVLKYIHDECDAVVLQPDGFFFGKLWKIGIVPCSGFA